MEMKCSLIKFYPPQQINPYESPGTLWLFGIFSEGLSKIQSKKIDFSQC